MRQYRKKKRWTGLIVPVVIIIAFVVLSLLMWEGPKKTVEEKPEVRNVTLTTRDGWNIHGTYYDGDEKGIVLLHMLNYDRYSWDDFPEKLKKNNYSVISIDLRGHGQSVTKVGSDKTIRWRKFDSSILAHDTNFDRMRYDVEAAAEYLRENESVKEVGVVGAEIGANVAAHYSTIGSPDTLVLLSPALGLNYWNDVPVVGPVRGYDGPILFVSSNDTEYSYKSTEIIYENAGGPKDFLRLEDAGRGTRMLNSELEGDVMAWLEEHM